MIGTSSRTSWPAQTTVSRSGDAANAAAISRARPPRSVLGAPSRRSVTTTTATAATAVRASTAESTPVPCL